MTKFLNEFSSKNMLSDYGLPTGNYYLATSEEEAINYSKKLGFPVVLKVVSDQIIHKTEAGGIKLNLQDVNDVANAYNEILSNASKYDNEALIDGILVSKMMPKGVEVIIGGIRDIQFGPVIMFGLGGVFVEVFKDVQFRMAPLNIKDAMNLIQSIKAYPMLNGFRGIDPINFELLSELIVKTGDFMIKNQDVVEIDLNPLICYDNKIQILDASIGISD